MTARVWQTPYCQTFFSICFPYSTPLSSWVYPRAEIRDAFFSPTHLSRRFILKIICHEKKCLTSYNVAVYISAGYETCHLYPHSQFSFVKPLEKSNLCPHPGVSFLIESRFFLYV